MDISDFYTADNHQEGAEMRVRKPSGELTDCYIRLVGVDSKLWRDIVRERQRVDLTRIINEEKDENTSAIDIAKATISWRGFEHEGKELEFSIEKAKQLYEAAPYILDQADIFIVNRSNFIKG